MSARLRRPGRGSNPWLLHFRPLLRSQFVQIQLAVGAMVADAILTLCRPWPLKVVIDRVISVHPRHSRVPFVGGWLDRGLPDPMHVLYGACACTLLIAIGTGLFTYYYTYAIGEVGRSFVFAVRRDLFAHMQRLSLRFHDRQRTGDLISRLTTDIQHIQDLISNGSIVFVTNSILLAGILVLMFWLNWRFALAALSVAPILFWTVLRSTTRIKIASRAARTSDGLLASLAQETLTSIRIVQGLAQEEQQNDRFEVRNAGSLVAYLEGIRYQARIAPLVDILSAMGLALVMWYGATSVRSGELSTGDVVVFFAYVTNLYSPMKALAKLTYAYNRASVGGERIIEVMSVRREVTDRPGAGPAPRLNGAIELRGVSFEYEPGHPVLFDINLTIAAGERVAIVGSTGAGKSTLVSLIPRLYDPTSGAVHIDGVDIRDYQVNSLRGLISLVLQDSLLFSGTIRENIAFGRPDASEEEIVHAAQVAYAEEFIRRLPAGYDAIVAERGTTLSGGQKQRIAIARAVLRDAPILILDEPTSGMDAAAERIVVEALERAAAGRTTLTIAHRLSTLQFADRIIVIEAGRVVEEGTPRELLSGNGKYAGLYRQQSVAGQSHSWPSELSVCDRPQGVGQK
jgi:ATP-binding cassette subfamily B protein